MRKTGRMPAKAALLVLVCSLVPRLTVAFSVDLSTSTTSILVRVLFAPRDRGEQGLCKRELPLFMREKRRFRGTLELARMCENDGRSEDYNDSFDHLREKSKNPGTDFSKVLSIVTLHIQYTN